MSGGEQEPRISRDVATLLGIPVDDPDVMPEYVVTPKRSGAAVWQWNGPAIAWEQQASSVISWEA